MDRTIHICSYVDVAGVAGARGGSRGVAERSPDGDGDGDGGGGDGNGDVPTTLPSGQSPGPSRPGTKYPVRGPSLTSTYDMYEQHIHNIPAQGDRSVAFSVRNEIHLIE